MSVALSIVNESLSDRAKRLRKALSDADTGPLVIAAEVVALSTEWPRYEAESGGKSVSHWLKKVLGPGKDLSYFAKRHEAVRILGEASPRTFHHEAALWAANNVVSGLKDAGRRVFLEKCFAAKRSNGHNPVTKAQAKRIAVECGFVQVASRKTCPGCEHLREECDRLRAALKVK